MHRLAAVPFPMTPPVSPVNGNDVARDPCHLRSRRRRRWALGLAALAGVGAGSVLLARLGPAVPTVDKSAVWTDMVRRGELRRQVRGVGTLVPEEVRWVAARTEARVERIAVFPGAAVDPETVVVVLSNPELQQAALDADAAVVAAQAKLVQLRAQLEGSLLERQAAQAHAEGEKDTAAAQVEVDERLSKKGLIAEIELRKSQIRARELAVCSDLERQRVAFSRQSVEPQLAVARGELETARAAAALRRGQLDALQVRAGMAGVLQAVPVEVGQRVVPGANLARVADPARLKAQVKVPETQARDVIVGLPARVDLRTGAPAVAARVSRVDPGAQGGTVLVDLAFEPGTSLPRGARPDLGIEGAVELEHLENVLLVGRPAGGAEDATVGLFRLEADGAHASRVPVRLGRGSLKEIEVRDGLREGERVILSDTTAQDGHARIRLN